MVKPKQGSGQSGAAWRLALAAVAGCILAPLAFVALTQSSSHQLTILSLQLSFRTNGALSRTTEEGGGSQQKGSNLTSLPLQLRIVHERNESMPGSSNEAINERNRNNLNADTEVSLGQNEGQIENRTIIDTEMTMQLPHVQEEHSRNNAGTDEKEEVATNLVDEQNIEQNDTIDSPNSSSESSIGNGQTESNADDAEKKSENKSVVDKDNVAQDSKLECNFSEPRSDTCLLVGNVRVHGKFSSIILASPAQNLPSFRNSTIKIRPYARKWEAPVMQHIREVLITPPSDSEIQVSPCSVKHTVPAVIFSTGGFLGNFFHDFTDVLVPLFATSRQFHGEVQFLVTDFNSAWISKYQPILKQLSRYRIIDMDAEDRVHCFPEAHVGLLSHKVFGIDPAKTPNGYSMIDFRQFLRSCFSLSKESVQVIPKKSRKKPRLLMILRKGSRSLMNAKEVVAMARSIGYKVIAAGPEDTRDLAKFSRIVNSCDVMMGVHGAGLANMVFLPANASLVQIIPWGGLKWACWHDYGEPAPGMGVNYVEYEIKEEESSLIQEYPRDHAVFGDPLSIHRQGWNQLWSIFLDKQKVRLDVARFRGVLLEIYQSLKR